MDDLQRSLPFVQRWRERRDSYRPAGEPIRTADYDVAEIPDNATAKAFVETHHYSGRYVAARHRFGLYRHGALAGVAVYSHPCSDAVLTSVFPDARASVELGRFVLLDDVPANGETWFIARTFELLRHRDIAGVVSFSDPMARRSVDGRIVFPGHVGTIYQAHNAVYLGRGRASTLRVLPDGRVIHARALQKIRAVERGWRYAAAILEEHGAEPFSGRRPGEWLARWLARLTTPLRHPGNHKYAWALHRAWRNVLPASQPYPKRFLEFFPAA